VAPSVQRCKVWLTPVKVTVQSVDGPWMVSCSTSIDVSLCLSPFSRYLTLNIFLLNSTGYKCSEVAEMGDCLARIDIGRKLGVPLWGRCAGSPSSTMWPGPRPTSLPSGILITHPFGHNKQAENWGGCAPLEKYVWPGPRPTSMPSFIVIDPAVSPQ